MNTPLRSIGSVPTLIVSSALLSVLATLPARAQEWEPLLDGKSLDGWEQRGGEARYTIEGDTVVGTAVKCPRNSFLCTKRHFGDFELRLEFKVDAGLNSGVQIRSHSIPEVSKGRVHGYQVEIDPSDRAWSAGIYDEARRGWLNDLKENQAAREAFRAGEWNDLRVLAVGNRIQTWLNGVAAADLLDPMTQKGFIALQVHGTPSEDEPQVRWRKLRIRDLGEHRWEGAALSDHWEIRGPAEWSIGPRTITASCPSGTARIASPGPWEQLDLRLRFRAKGDGRCAVWLGGSSGTRRCRATFLGSTANLSSELREDEEAISTRAPHPAIQLHEGWNDLAVASRDGRVAVHVNGRILADYRDPGLRAPTGIAFEIEGAVELRDFELLSPVPR